LGLEPRAERAPPRAQSLGTGTPEPRNRNATEPRAQSLGTGTPQSPEPRAQSLGYIGTFRGPWVSGHMRGSQ